MGCREKRQCMWWGRVLQSPWPEISASHKNCSADFLSVAMKVWAADHAKHPFLKKGPACQASIQSTLELSGFTTRSALALKSALQRIF